MQLDKDAFAMLPGMSAEKSSALKEKHGAKTSLYKYASMPAADRAESTEVESVLDALPLITVSMKSYVEGDEECCVGDTLTVKIRAEFKRLKEGQSSGYVHSKSYPFLRTDSWYMVITDPTFQGIAACEKLEFREDFFSNMVEDDELVAEDV